MNRLHHLKQTLLRNITDNSDYEKLEFVLLDYNSNDGLIDYVKGTLMPYIKNGKLRYYRTEEPVHYNMSHSRNIAFKLAQGDIVCNIDADNYTSKEFAQYVNAIFEKNQAIFLSTHHNRQVKNDALGRICVKKEDFLAVGGYDEQMKHYGFDDYDFANRLSMYGLKPFTIQSPEFLLAIPHSDQERMANVPEKNVLHRLLIRYNTPAESELLLLFADGQYRRATMVSNFVSNALNPSSNRSTQYRFSIKERQWESGHWRLKGQNFRFVSDISGNFELKKVGSQQRWQDRSGLVYYGLESQQQQETILFFYNQLSNRNIMEENLRERRILANHSGFGQTRLVPINLNV